MNIFYFIVIAATIILSLSIVSIAVVAAGKLKTEEEQAYEDAEQIAFLREWRKKSC